MGTQRDKQTLRAGSDQSLDQFSQRAKSKAQNGTPLKSQQQKRKAKFGDDDMNARL